MNERMRRKGALLTAAALVAIGLGVLPHAAPETRAILGRIALPEISGATVLPNGSVLVVNDEGSQVCRLNPMVLDGRDLMLGDELTPSPLTEALGKSREFVDDVEDLTWISVDGKPRLYLFASHSLNKKGKGKDEKPERFFIATAPITDEPSPKVTRLSPDFIVDPEIMVADANLADLVKKSRVVKPENSGFNIEGATFDQSGNLFIGLRSPLSPNGDALVLVADDRKDNRKWPIKTAHQLKLGGEGIRGLCYDNIKGGIWMLSGKSADPPDGQPQDGWSLWFWKTGEANPSMHIWEPAMAEQSSRLQNAEAICILPASGNTPRSLLLFEDRKFENGNNWTNYLLMPVP